MQEDLPTASTDPLPISEADTTICEADSSDLCKPTAGNNNVSIPPTLDQPPKLGRRMSLPCNDPLLRVFDQMTQPDTDFTKAVNLRRNFSLTDRRRSSLLRGLFNRSSLKPGRGKLVRPTTVGIADSCNDSKRGTRAALQTRETRFLSPVTVQFNEDVLSENTSPIKNYPPTFEGEDDCFSKMDQKENTVGAAQQLVVDERLTRRRGSAPCNLILAEPKMSTLLREQNCLNVNVRRGSLPSELLKDSLPKQMRNRVLNLAMANASNSNKTKSLLRRRSMGPELLNMHHPHHNMMHHQSTHSSVARDRQKFKSRPI